MIKSMLGKSTLREIRATLNRFLAIFAIVALGVGFFAGLKATTPDMKQTADRYYRENSLMDVRLLSTFGFKAEDGAAIAALEGVDYAVPSYTMDALISGENGDRVLRFHGLTNDPEKPLNQPILLEGRLPETAEECAVEQGTLQSGNLQIGDTLQLSRANTAETADAFATDSFRIVGTVRSPQYISFGRGSTDMGNGSVSAYVLVRPEAFALDTYTELLVKLKDSGESSFSKAYQDQVDAQIEAMKPIAQERKTLRYDEIVGKADEELAKGKKELEESRREAETKLQEAKVTLDEAKLQLDDGTAQLEQAQRQLMESEGELERQKADFAAKSDEAHGQIADGYTRMEEAKRSLAEGQVQLGEGEAQLAQLRAQIEKLTAAGQLEQAAVLQAQGDAAQTELAAQRAALEAGQAELAQQGKVLAQKEQELAAGEALANEGFVAAASAINEGWEKLPASQRELEAARQSYDDGLLEYNQKRAEAQEELNAAQEKLADSEREIRQLKKPEWYFLDRNSNPGYEGFGQDAERINAVAAVFPVFFFSVAALVCLTTMTRMVEEQRMQIGTLKALGYSKRAIAGSYLVYAALASVLGSAAGLAVGFWLFPTVIWNAYQSMYDMPAIWTTFNVRYALISSLLAIFSTTLAALCACAAELRETPAQLMRPKAPKAGKRIFFEKIPFIWKRMSFSWKVTMRNLLRYKQRFFMTVIGIGGCAALMLTGFGLKDSIMGIGTKQFNELYQYQMVVGIEEAGSGQDQTKLNERLRAQTEDSLYSAQYNVELVGKKSLDSYLVVPEDGPKLEEFIRLQERVSRKKLPMAEDTVLLSEKAARETGVAPGDTLTLKKGETTRVQVTVGGITENYVHNYVYMAPQLYETLFGEPPELNQILCKVAGTGTEEQRKLEEERISTDLLSIGNVRGVSFLTSVGKLFEDVLQGLNAVVVVLILCANMLAFVVLYNLTNINITERKRELASIKVLGFFDKEVSSYVYRENILLTVIGTALGLLMGILLHRFVVATAEVDVVMFERAIHGTSYLWSALLTFAFAGLVNFVMYFKLKKINMVESLKSME